MPKSKAVQKTYTQVALLVRLNRRDRGKAGYLDNRQSELLVFSRRSQYLAAGRPS